MFVRQASRLVVLGNAPFEESEHLRQCDLVIVESMRRYRTAYDNAAKALRLAQPGGLVVWPDYARSPETRAQDRVLRTLAHDIPLAQIAGTRLITYRAPGLLSRTPERSVCRRQTAVPGLSRSVSPAIRTAPPVYLRYRHDARL